MIKFWKDKPALGVGLGVGVIGALALAVRYALRHSPRQPIPQNISPDLFATRVAQTGFGQMVYHTAGAGDAMLFLHGVYPGASSFEWSRVYTRFARDHQVIAPDLLGFGESERPRPGLDADQHTQAVADALRDIPGTGPCTVVASGFGASIAIKLAVQHPELVRSLVLLAPEGVRGGRRREPRGIKLLARMPRVNSFVYRHAISRPPFVRDWLRRFGLGGVRQVSDENLSVITTCAAQYGAEHAILGFLRGRGRYDVVRQTARISQPTTILWPSDDPQFPLSAAEDARESIQFCRILTHPEVCPLAALESPDVIDTLVRSALGPTPMDDAAEIAA